MKVLLFSGNYPSDENPIPSIFTHNQVKALKKKGIEVAVFIIDIRSIRKKRKLGYSKYIYDGVQVYRYALPCGPIPYVIEHMSKLSAIIGFKKVVKEFGKPDIIHAHFSLAGLCAVSIKKKYNIPYIITEHGSGLIKDEISNLTKKIIYSAYNNADYLIAVGSALKEKMQSFTQKMIYVIPNILPSSFKPNFIPKHEKFTFISVGGLGYRKRVDLTISAFSKLYQRFSNIQLKIVGTGPLLSFLKKSVVKLRIENAVEFIGNVPNQKMPEIYQKCHCFVLPSMIETFGVVYAEAAACGLPIIATDCGGPSDIVNNINGLLIPRDNEYALYKAMKYIYENIEKYDSTMISNDILSRFGENVISEKILAVYLKVADE